MPAMLIRHRVADFDLWKPSFDAHGIARRANGSRGGWLFRSADDPTEVVVLLEWDDLERARLFADSDDLREVLGQAGASGRPDIRFLDDIERLSV